MVLTLARCGDHIKQSLGLRPEISTYELVNLAGQYLVGMAPWRWLERTGRVSTTTGQTYVDLTGLPGFQSMIRVTFTSGVAYSLVPTSFDDLLDQRTTGSGNPTGYSIVWNSTTDGHLFPVIELDWAPTVGVVNAITAYYRAGWQPPRTNLVTFANATWTQSTRLITLTGAFSMYTFSPGDRVTLSDAVNSIIGPSFGVTTPTTNNSITLTSDISSVDDAAISGTLWRQGDDQALIAIPEFIEPLYLEVLRAYARAYEEEDIANLSQRMQSIETGPVLLNAHRRDGMLQANFGQLRGGGVAAQMTSFPTRRMPSQL